MRGADIIGCLFQCHAIAVDVLCPYIAYPLLAFKIIGSHPFHGNRRVLKMGYLPAVRIPVLEPGIKHNENQYANHNDHVDNND